MGYTTDFTDTFEVTPPFKPEHIAYLKEFSDTRRMKRDPELTKDMPDPIREAVGLPLGVDAGYFVGANLQKDHSLFGNCAGQAHTPDVVDYNNSPEGQPGLWCAWIPGGEYGTVTEEDHFGWNGGEKFYEYIAWLKYEIKHFLEPWGYTLNGVVEWRGEDDDDFGEIIVEDNQVRFRNGIIERSWGPIEEA